MIAKSLTYRFTGILMAAGAPFLGAARGDPRPAHSQLRALVPVGLLRLGQNPIRLTEQGALSAVHLEPAPDLDADAQL